MHAYMSSDMSDDSVDSYGMSIMMHARTRESVARQRLTCTLMQGAHFHPAIASPKSQLNSLALRPCNAARQLALDQ